MRLTVIGSAAAWARDPDAIAQGGGRAGVVDAASSCYLVEGGTTAILLDIGQGAFAALRAHRPPESLAAVFVSHPHPDHCVDLIPLRHYLRYEAATAPGTVALHAAAGLPERFDALFGESDFLHDLRFVALEPGTFVVGSLRVGVAPVTHTLGSFAFRVSAAHAGRGGDGRSVVSDPDRGGAPTTGLVYSGDCGAADDLVPLLRPGDTLLAEASFGADGVPADAAHLDSREAARAAREGSAARLVLTHIQPTVDRDRALEAARSFWDGETLLARPGLVLEM